MTTSSFLKGSCPSPDAVASTHISLVGMLPAKSCWMLSVTFNQLSAFIFLPVCRSNCLKPSTPMRATASVSWPMQLRIILSTSSSRKAKESKCASKSLTNAVRACKHVGGPSAASGASTPSGRPCSGPPSLRWSCIWWWISSNNGLITPLNTILHVSSSKELSPCFCKQSNKPLIASARTSRRRSLTSEERPLKIVSHCSAGCLLASVA
mmetsp:Transcript_24347/g.73121  ORF Transcript_24347/g.73121 Transcript_24347/m.73121 type:complete len:209 (-) Transcript_24347:3005-3631(-)